jgi:hypothetical protein
LYWYFFAQGRKFLGLLYKFTEKKPKHKIHPTTEGVVSMFPLKGIVSRIFDIIFWYQWIGPSFLPMVTQNKKTKS